VPGVSACAGHEHTCEFMQGVSVQGVSACTRCECRHKAGGVCRGCALMRGVQGLCVQVCACKAEACVQGVRLQATRARAKRELGAEGLRVLSSAGTAMPPPWTHWGAGWGQMQHPGQQGVRGDEGKGHPRLPATRSREGAGALSVEGGLLYFDDNFPVFGAVRFLVSSPPSAELLHVFDTAIVF